MWQGAQAQHHLVETWHDADSVCIRRLRADGYQVVDRPRPRLRDDTTASNHGGITAVAFSNARLEPIDTGIVPGTFELSCLRISSNTSSCIVAVIYRLGSASVSTVFYTELADVLDRLVTFIDPVYIVGDLNVRLDRPGDSSAAKLIDLLADYTTCRAGLIRRPTTTAAYLMLSPRAMICRRRRWMSSTSVCRITVFYVGQCR